jgi:hypothetical protein
VPCLTPHVWYADAPMVPGACVTINVGQYHDLIGVDALPKIIAALADCYCYPHPVRVNLYAEEKNPDHMHNLNSPELACALRGFVGN